MGAMADIAFVFHWPPAVMEPMSLEELGQWQQLAIERVQASQGES